jgi:predicted lipoprotein with Yx(FWY)xxD motif
MESRGILSAAVLVALALAPSVRAQPAAAGIAGLTEQKTIFGTAYADAVGKTLYSFDGDSTPGRSSCTEACARDWRPFPVPRIAKPVGDWSVVLRDDGARQWAWKGKPLYTYAADLTPSEINGDGVDGKWHAFMSVRNPQPADVTVRNTEFGPTLATAQGMTLYMVVQYRWNAAANNTPRHVGPSPGVAACSGDCARTWQPLKAPANAKESGDWTVVARDDGARQWAWKGHPLYTYAKDERPGDALGEGNHILLNGITGYFWEAANLL